MLLALTIAIASAPPDFEIHDSTAPTVFVVATSRQGGARVSEVTYTFRGKRIRALLIAPAHASGRPAGVLFAHWLGDVPTTNRTEFRADAMWLAQRGIVSLLPDEPWSAPHWFNVVRKRESDARDATLTVAGLRRALDVLVATNAVDPKRLGFVGHDFGAMYGALLLAFDRRPAVAVFMTPTTTFREWFDLDTKRPPPDAAAYERQLAAFDLPPYLAHTKLRASLVQFAARDEYVSAAKAKAFAAALSPHGRTVRTYETGHALAIKQATNDRRSWLAAHLH